MRKQSIPKRLNTGKSGASPNTSSVMVTFMIFDSNNTVTRRNSLHVYGTWWPENPSPPPHKTPPSFLMLLFFTTLYLFPANICFLYLPVQTRTIFEVGYNTPYFRP